MDEPASEDRAPSRLGQLISDPVRLRYVARVTLVLTTLANAVGWAVLSGPLRSLLLAAGWLMVPLLAAGLGIGDGFFVGHGRGVLRAALTAIAGVAVALLACALLAAAESDSASWPGEAISGTLYGLLTAAVTLALGALAALAIGRGSGYLARRIQEVDDEGW